MSSLDLWRVDCTFIQQFHHDNTVYSDELKLGMYHLIDCLDLWLNEISDIESEISIIEIYNADIKGKKYGI